MSTRSHHTVLVAILLAIGATPILSQTSSANESSFVSIPPQVSSLKIAQTPAEEREERLQRQREAERVLKEGERLKREVRDSGNPYLRQRVNEEVTKVRESGGDSTKVQQSDRELNRLREQNNRSRYNYGRFGYPYNNIPVIVVPGSGYGEYYIPSNNNSERFKEHNSDHHHDDFRSPRRTSNPNFVQILASAGFKNGNTSPGIGIRYNNIGLEVAGIFNQDSLPGILNDYSLPSNFLSNDLGIKKVSPQWGGDFLGFLDVNPQVSLYGSVGVYLQSLSRVAQSQATSELYKQTDETNVTGAVGGGLALKPSENVSIGVGYHSIRGVTANLGVKF
jgi:opacity protein-like surface antigen